MNRRELDLKRGVWPRRYWLRWVRIIGPRYAHPLTKVHAQFLFAWGGVFVPALVLMPIRLISPSSASVDWATWTSLILLIAWAYLFPLLLVARRKVILKMVQDLRDGGANISALPILVSERGFLQWCSKQHLDPEQVLRLGAEDRT